MNDPRMEYNANNTIAAQFTQAGSILNAVDKNEIKKQAKDIANRLSKEIGKNLAENNDIVDALKTSYKKAERALNDIKAKANNQEILPLRTEDVKEYEKYLKKIKNDQELIKNLSAELAKEENKKHKDQSKVLDLTEQIAKTQAEATADINIRVQLMQKLIKGSEIQAQLERVRNEKNEEERKKQQEALDALREEFDEINDIQKSIQDNLTDDLDALTKALAKARENLADENKKFGQHLNDLRDLISTAETTFQGVRNLGKTWATSFGDLKDTTQINRYNTDIDQYLKNQMKLSSSFGLYSDNEGFNTLKNDIIDGMTEGIGNIYNQEQIMESLSTISEMGFNDHSTAITMAKDIAYAKEYMGMSSESLKSMYELQVRSGDDNFLKRSLNSIIALQNTGVSLTKEQLEAANKQNLEITEAMAEMGMSNEAMASVNEQLNALYVAGEKIQPGLGQELIDTFKDITNGGVDTMAELGISNPDAVWNAYKYGNLQPMLNALMNSEATTAFRRLTQGDYGVGDTIIRNDVTSRSGLYSRLTDETMSSLMSEFNKNLDILEKNPNALDEERDKTAEKVADYTKMNEYVEKALRSDWLDLSSGIGTNAYWDAKWDEIQGWFSPLTTLLTLGSNVISILSGFKTLFGGFGGSGTEKVAEALLESGGSEGLSLGAKLFGSASTAGTLANRLSAGTGKLAGTAKGTAVGTASIVAGAYATYQTLKDGIDVGTNGYKDANGNRIEGTGGLGDGLAAAVTNDKMGDSAWDNVGGGILSGTGKGAAIGAAIGTIVPGIGTAVGAAVGGGIGLISGLIGGMHKENKRQELIKQKELEKQTKFLETTSENVSSIKNSRDSELANRYNDDRWGYGSINNTPVAPSYNYSYGSTNNWTTTSGYGNRIFDGYKEDHNGIDLSGMAFGTEIGSAGTGIVTKVVDGYTWKDSNLRGGNAKSNYVDVYDPINDVTYRYYHLAGAAVTEGQEVTTGTPIGYVGNTGDVRPIPTNENPEAGTHLHFSVMKNGAYINPEPYINNSMFNTPVRTNKLSNINIGRVSDKEKNDIMSINDSNIIENLKAINDTLIAMDKRQSDQQKILNALTNTPIHNLGV